MSKKQSIRKNVYGLMEKAPAVSVDYKFLILSYWMMYDGIDIPKELMYDILTKGTEPETISRAKRKNKNIMFDADSLVQDLKEFVDATSLDKK